MELDTVAIVRWLDPLARRPEEIAEVFAGRRRSVAVDWLDGRPSEPRICSTDGISARWRRGPRQSLASVSRCDDEAARDAIRAVQKDAGISPIPVRPLAPHPPRPLEPGVAAERWTRRLAAVLPRHTPRHRLALTPT